MLRTTMRALATALALSCSLAHAKPPAPPASAASGITSPAASAQESQLVEHGHNTKKPGAAVHSPAHTVTGQEPAGASAKGHDGTFSFSQHHRGTCSHHGGVDAWL